jgi:hypothetical protein
VSSLDEQTHGEDVAWGEVRSSCAARDWRRAWEAVGVDHEGGVTPGEVYIFGAARLLACVSAALFHWRAAYRTELEDRTYYHHPGLRVPPSMPPYEASWARIKAIASWRSSAKAQYAERVAPVVGVDCTTDTWAASGAMRFSMTVNGRPIEMFAPRSDEVIAGWPEPIAAPLEDLRQAMAQREPVRGTVVMSPAVARQLERMGQAAASGSTLAAACTRSTNPNPRGPAQRKRRGR